MQPQGHVQVLINMLIRGMSPQAALDAPRFCIEPKDGRIFIEEGVSAETIEALSKRGHCVQMRHGYKRAVFGRGQAIHRWSDHGVQVLQAGSDGRGDGCAMGY